MDAGLECAVEGEVNSSEIQLAHAAAFEIGLVRIHLMESGGNGQDVRCTGRAVAFSNSLTLAFGFCLFHPILAVRRARRCLRIIEMALPYLGDSARRGRASPAV
jgi:hypothetical protein